MNAGTVRRLAWPVAGLLSTALAVSVIVTWAGRQDPGNATLQEAAVALHAVHRREQVWFTNNHAYSPLVEDLHLTAGLPPRWNFQVLATTMNEQPVLLVEADDGLRRLCIDRNGTLFQSSTRKGLELTPWIPAPSEVTHASGQ